ncbi:MAG: CvpA family protein [Bacteroidales bacterium]|nr:CvpA family protein [Bacteroidales bacterium]
MQVFDIVLLALFVPAIIHGVVKGLITQVVSLASVIVGAIVAGRFAPDLKELAMLQFNSDERVTYIICFILIFLICALVMALIGHFVTKLFKIATLGWLNRLLGGLFAVFTAALVLGMLISAFDGLNSSWNLVKAESLENLRVYPMLRDFATGILPQLKIFVGQYVTPGTEVCALL